MVMLTRTRENELWYFALDKYFAEKGITAEDYEMHHDLDTGGIFSRLDDATVSFEYGMWIVHDSPKELAELNDFLCDQCGLFLRKKRESNEEDVSLVFNVYKDTAIVGWVHSPEKFGEEFAGYRIEEKYPAEEFLLKVLDYFLARFNPEESRRIANKQREERFTREGADPTENEGRMSLTSKDERSIPQDARYIELQRLEQKIDPVLAITKGHPLLLQGEDTYLPRLYVRAINDDVNNLQVLEYEQQRIPYVLVESADLGGLAGKPFLNLYFVAKDKAPEKWQQQIVAFHESLCVKIGHQEAQKKELALARQLGKEVEYHAWGRKLENR